MTDKPNRLGFTVPAKDLGETLSPRDHLARLRAASPPPAQPMMTRVALLKELCDVTDALTRLPQSIALAACISRLDVMIDACAHDGMEPLFPSETSPCPHCGQDVCTTQGDRHE